MSCELTHQQLEEFLLVDNESSAWEYSAWRAVRLHVAECQTCRCRIEEILAKINLQRPSAVNEAQSPSSLDQSRLIAALDLAKNRSFEPNRRSSLTAITWLVDRLKEIGAIDEAALSKCAADELPAELGRYSLKRIIGQGGMAIVAAATDRQLQREVAIKFLLPRGCSPGSLPIVEREARAAARIRHANVLEVYEIIQPSDDLRGIVMEYLAGGALQQRLTRGPIAPREAVEIMLQISAGLEVVHEAGLLHRDLKPANILFGSCGRAVLADFGLAKSTTAQSLTDENLLPGTPEYVCPEWLEGRPASRQSDIYQLGLTLYALLAGASPYQGTCQEVLRKIRAREIAPIRQAAPVVDADLGAICETAISHAPSDRYATVADFQADLQRWLRGEPPEAMRLRRLRKAVRAVKGHYRKVIVGAGLALTLLGFAQRLNWHAGQQRAAARQLSELTGEHRRMAIAEQSAQDSVRQLQTQLLSTVLLANQPQVVTRRSVEQKLLGGVLEGTQALWRSAINRQQPPEELAPLAQAVGSLHQRLGRHEDCIQALLECERLYAECASRRQPSESFLESAANCERGLAESYLEIGQADRAERHALDAAARFEQLKSQGSKDQEPKYLIALARVHSLLSAAAMALGRTADAHRARLAAESILDDLDKRFQDALSWPDLRRHAVEAWRQLARQAAAAEQWLFAAQCLGRCLRETEQIEGWQRAAEDRRNLGIDATRLADISLELGNAAEGKRWAALAKSHLEEAVSNGLPKALMQDEFAALEAIGGRLASLEK